MTHQRNKTMISERKGRKMKLDSIKRFALDFLYGTVALIALNGIITFLVYPFINRTLGNEANGQVLFFTAIMGLMASAFGSGVNYARMKISTVRHSENGDYNYFLLAVAILAVIITIVASFIKGNRAGASVISIAILIIVTVLRYYADVQFRLDLNYKRFFWYYIFITIGYGIGVFTYRWTNSWTMIFITGECFGLIYVTIVGNIFKRPFFKRSDYFAENTKVMWNLSSAYLMSDFVSYADRVMIPLLIVNGDEASTIFYVSTLLGKMVSLLSTPLNGVIVGHLSRYKGKITKKMFAGVTGILLACAGIFVCGSVIGSYIIIPLIYNADVMEAASKLFWIANAGQVFFFISNTMMVVVLRFATEKYQIYMGTAYTILFIVIIIPFMFLWGLWGMAVGLLIINILKFCIITGLGFYALGEKKEK